MPDEKNQRFFICLTLYPSWSMLFAMVECYIGIGGNLSKTFEAMKQGIDFLKNDPEITDFKVSRLYRTTPVSHILQPLYLNAVCKFQTTLPLKTLWDKMHRLEEDLGKVKKPKHQPRLIDLDLLFYGSLIAVTKEWIVPHPRWHERLFVLVPLADITESLPIEGGLPIKELLEKFSNPHKEFIFLYEEGLDHALSSN